MIKSMEAKKIPKCAKKGLQAVWGGWKIKYEVRVEARRASRGQIVSSHIKI